MASGWRWLRATNLRFWCSDGTLLKKVPLQLCHGVMSVIDGRELIIAHGDTFQRWSFDGEPGPQVEGDWSATNANFYDKIWSADGKCAVLRREGQISLCPSGSSKRCRIGGSRR